MPADVYTAKKPGKVRAWSLRPSTFPAVGRGQEQGGGVEKVGEGEKEMVQPKGERRRVRNVVRAARIAARAAGYAARQLEFQAATAHIATPEMEDLCF